MLARSIKIQKHVKPAMVAEFAAGNQIYFFLRVGFSTSNFTKARESDMVMESSSKTKRRKLQTSLGRERQTRQEMKAPLDPR
jgi:hypothetical protein